MSANDRSGWLLFRTTADARKLNVENIGETLDELEDGETRLAQMRRSWMPISDCLLREDGIVIYAEIQSGSQVTKVNLTINPSAKSKGDYELLKGGRRRHGKIVTLRAEECPPFIHFFRFESVSLVKNEPEDLSWQVAILRPSNST